MDEGSPRVYYDASGYILFESSGDSESRWEMEQDDQAGAEDDAQSAIGRGSEVAGLLSDRSDHGVHESSPDDRHQSPMSCNEEDDDEDEEEEGEEEEGVVDQCRGKADQRRKKDGSDDEPDAKAMSESERDKLFWDACLASS